MALQRIDYSQALQAARESLKKTIAQESAAPAPSFTVPQNCPVCKGRGWVYHNFPMMDQVTKQMNPDFGKAFPCICRRQSSEEKLKARMMKFCELPDGADPKTFGNYEVKPGFEEAYQAALDFVARGIIFLTYSSPVNYGKTHLATAVTHEFIDAGIPAKFYVCDLFLKDLKATFDDNPAGEPYHKLYERACTVPLLIIDDLFEGKVSEWGTGEIETLLNARYVKKLATLITTNKTMAEIETKSPRITSRLQRESWCRVITMSGLIPG